MFTKVTKSRKGKFDNDTFNDLGQISSEKKKNETIININDLVDSLLAKVNSTSKVKYKSKRTSLRIGQRFSTKKLLSISISVLLLFAVIASASSFIDSSNPPIDLVGIAAEDTIILQTNQTEESWYNDNSTFQDNESLVNNESSELNGNDTLPKDDDINTSLNKTVIFVGLNLTLNCDKNIYNINETIIIEGTVTYNNSLINTSVNILVSSPNYNLSESLNIFNGRFVYEFVPFEIGSYIVHVLASYLNESVQKEIVFDVLGIPVENVSENVSFLSVWDDSDNQNVFVGEYVTFFANYSGFNGSILNASCLISFNMGGRSSPVEMSYVDGLYQFNRSFSVAGSYQFRVSCSADGFETKSVIDNFVVSEVVTDVSEVSIVDPKRDEYVYVIPGTSFYVERTINGPNGINAVFAPLFSDGLTIEKFEIFKGGLATGQALEIVRDVTPQVFAADRGVSIVERRIDDLRNSLPENVKQLNRVSYSESFVLDGPVTVRVWFKTPSWEEIISGVVPSSGLISYLTFTGESFDFEGSTWWNANWGKRKLITINSSQVDNDLTNFPILVYNSSDSDLAAYAQSDGDDIAFVLYSDNSTKLNHEIENYTTSGQIVAWVNVTAISSSSDTKIWMYYNNSGCSSQENVAGTWDSNYKGVWHLADTPSGADDIKDSTGIYNGTSQNMESTDQVPGQINGCLLFDGNGEYVLIPDSSDWTLSSNLNWTLEGWFNFSTLPGGGDWDSIIDTPNDDYCFQFNEDSGDTTVNWYDGVLDHESSGQSSITTNEFHYGALVLDFGVSSGSSWYLDGFSLGTFTAENRAVNPTGLTISGVSVWTYFTGNLDEIRFSNILRNASWISTTYNTVNNCSSTFLSFGSEEIFEINTSVETISPYEQTTSPLSITADGDSGLDNVTLWYRFSSDNSTWWNANWTSRKNFTFDNSGQSEYLENFTVLVNLSSSNFDYSKAKNDGTDLRFIGSDGTTELKYHIEKWNISGFSYVWVNVTNITANSDTDYILMYYNNSEASDVQDESGTYDEYFDSVFHLDDLTGSTGINAAIEGGSPTAVSTGFIGDCYDFESEGGDDDYLAIDGTNVQTDDAWTLEVWLNPETSDEEDYWYGYLSPDLDIGINNNAPNIWDGAMRTGSTTINTGTWYYLVYTAGDEAYYVNGVEDTDVGGGFDNFDIRDVIGAAGTNGLGIDGRLDEFRASAVTRSADWIEAQYLSMTDNFITYNSEEAWMQWDNISNPDTNYASGGWNWTFDFPNGTGYYEFYSIGKKSGSADETAPNTKDASCYYNPPVNLAPTQSGEAPTNDSIGISITPALYVVCSDSNAADTLNATWWSNSSGAWIQFASNWTSFVSDTNITQTNSNFSNYSTTYYWSVNLTDGEGGWNNETYHFTTTSISTSVDTISPYIITYSPLNITVTGPSDLDNVTLWYRWSDNNWSTYEGYGIFNGSESTLGADFNDPTYKVLKWDNQSFDDNYFSYTVADPNNITCDVAGDYMIALSLPIYDLTQSGADNNRMCIEAAVYVDGTRVEVGTARSSYLRGEGGAQDHFKSSDNFVVLVPSVAQGSNIEIYVKGNGDTTETVGTDNNYALYIEFVNSSETIFFANATTTTASSSNTNLNQGTENTFNEEMEWKEIIKDTGFTHNDASNEHIITIDDPGYYFVSVNIPLGGAITRGNVGGAVQLDGITIDGGTFLQGYIRNADGHQDSSIHWAGLVKTNSNNENLTISVGRWAAAGTITTDGLNATIFIRKLADNTGIFQANATQVSGASTDDWNPDTTEYALWNTAMEKDTNYFYHGDGNQNITVLQDGLYLLSFNSPRMTTTGQREAPQFTIYVNDVAQYGSRTGSSYIRDSDGADESSTVITYALNLSANDDIEIGVIRCDSTTTTAVDDQDEGVLFIEYKGELSSEGGWIEWSDSSNPDAESPWSWDFDFPNGTGYYEFYSLGKKSGSTDEAPPNIKDASCFYNASVNNAPTQTGEAPINGSTGINTTPALYVVCSDIDAGDTLNATWWSNSSGSWVQFATNWTSFASGTNITQTNTNFTEEGKSYWWSINLTDGTDWTNVTYHFTTANTSIDIIPSQWDIGTTTIGNNNYSTSGNYFNLTNNGTVTLNIQIKASNATNATTGASWNLTSTPGFDNYSLQYNKSSDVSWTNINLTYDIFVNSLNIDSWETFDLNLFMATTSTKGDPLSITITFRSILV